MEARPEDLLAEIARMEKARRRHRPAGLLLAALAAVTAAAALGISGWAMAVFAQEGPADGIRMIEARVQAAATELTAAVREKTAERPAGQFQWPCEGFVTSPFGPRSLFGTDGFHRGTDIAAPLGTEIRAAAGGTVCFVGEKGTYGNLIQIDHGNGYVTCYAHCSALLADEGDWVEQGQAVALVGETGRATGPHCHFEIRLQGEPLDPETCLP